MKVADGVGPWPADGEAEPITLLSISQTTVALGKDQSTPFTYYSHPGLPHPP